MTDDVTDNILPDGMVDSLDSVSKKPSMPKPKLTPMSLFKKIMLFVNSFIIGVLAVLSLIAWLMAKSVRSDVTNLQADYITYQSQKAAAAAAS